MSLCYFPAFLTLMAIGSAAPARGSAHAADEASEPAKGPGRSWVSPRIPVPTSSQPKPTRSPSPRPRMPAQLLRTITAEPHVAGTPADYKTAVFVRDKLREWGWKAEIAEMEVLLNYPTQSAGRDDHSSGFEAAFTR